MPLPYKYSVSDLLAQGHSASSIRLSCREDVRPGRLIPATQVEHAFFSSLPLTEETTVKPTAEEIDATVREARNAVRRRRYAERRAEERRAA